MPYYKRSFKSYYKSTGLVFIVIYYRSVPISLQISTQIYQVDHHVFLLLRVTFAGGSSTGAFLKLHFDNSAGDQQIIVRQRQELTTRG